MARESHTPGNVHHFVLTAPDIDTLLVPSITLARIKGRAIAVLQSAGDPIPPALTTHACQRGRELWLTSHAKVVHRSREARKCTFDSCLHNDNRSRS
jgi:hypothetical protein